MEGFEQFKKKPLTREELEARSRGVRKTGEILRGMEQSGESSSVERGATPAGYEAAGAESAPVMKEEKEKVAGDTRILEMNKRLEETQKGMEQIPGYQEIRRALSSGSQGEVERLKREFPDAFARMQESLIEMKHLHREKDALLEEMTRKGLEKGEQKAA